MNNWLSFNVFQEYLKVVQLTQRKDDRNDNNEAEEIPCSHLSIGLKNDLTGDFCTSRSERESLTRRTAGYAKQEVQGRTD